MRTCTRLPNNRYSGNRTEGSSVRIEISRINTTGGSLLTTSQCASMAGTWRTKVDCRQSNGVGFKSRRWCASQEGVVGIYNTGVNVVAKNRNGMNDGETVNGGVSLVTCRLQSRSCPPGKVKVCRSLLFDSRDARLPDRRTAAPHRSRGTELGGMSGGTGGQPDSAKVPPIN